MSRPEGIDADVWDAAELEAMKLFGGSESMLTEGIARAILAERERCANILRARPDPYGIMAESIAAIRKGGE